MSRDVFIFGAGASKEAGAPLMYDFLDVARGLLDSGVVKEHASQFQGVFQAIGVLQRSHSKSELDIVNIESVFSAFEMAALLGTELVLDEDVEQGDLIAEIRMLILRTLEKTTKFRTKRGSPRPIPPSVYNEFASKIAKESNHGNHPPSVSVLTFNYDVACDLAMFVNGLGPEYKLGVPTTVPARRSVDLLKLHGSLNWSRCQVCKKIVPWYPAEFWSKFRIDSLFQTEDQDYEWTIGSQVAKHIHCEEPLSGELVIIPPTWNKGDLHKGIASVWEAAARHLRQAENIYVIGYSLPESDLFFRYLYALGTVGPSPLKRFWVFNPDQQVKARFETLLGPGAKARFRFFDFPFSRALSVIFN